MAAGLGSYLDELERLIERAEAETGTHRDAIAQIVREILIQPSEKRSMIRLASQEMSHLGEAARIRFAARYYRQFIGRIQAVVEGGIAAGELRLVDVSTATWSLLGMMYPYFNQTELLPDLRPSPTTIDEIVTIYLDGIGLHA